MQNLITIPEGVSFPRTREICALKIVYSASFGGSSNAPQPRPQYRFHAQYVKKLRGSAQGCAFLELENKQKITLKPSYPENRHFYGAI